MLITFNKKISIHEDTFFINGFGNVKFGLKITQQKIPPDESRGIVKK